jgi:hypothetical protein
MSVVCRTIYILRPSRQSNPESAKTHRLLLTHPNRAKQSPIYVLLTSIRLALSIIYIKLGLFRHTQVIKLAGSARPGLRRFRVFSVNSTLPGYVAIFIPAYTGKHWLFTLRFTRCYAWRFGFL